MNSNSFIRRHFLLLLGVLLIVDWILEYPFIELYLSPGSFGDPPIEPNLTRHVLEYLTRFGFTQMQWLKIIWWLTLLPMLGLLLRRLAPLCAFLVWSGMLFWWSLSFFAFYGFHIISGIFLFVAAFGHWGHDGEMPWIWSRRFLCAIYFGVGFSKLLSPEWRHGEVLWSIACSWLTKNHFSNTAWLSPLSWLFVLSSWIVIATQILAPILLIRPRFSTYLFWGNLIIYVGIVLGLRLVMFPLLMIFLNASFLYDGAIASLPKLKINVPTLRAKS